VKSRAGLGEGGGTCGTVRGGDPATQGAQCGVGGRLARGTGKRYRENNPHYTQRSGGRRGGLASRKQAAGADPCARPVGQCAVALEAC